jgi:hypothetical protein
MWYEMPLSSAHNGATVINFVRGENEWLSLDIHRFLHNWTFWLVPLSLAENKYIITPCNQTGRQPFNPTASVQEYTCRY